MSLRTVSLSAVPLLLASSVAAQALPTRQPPYIEIIKEFEKPGHGMAHEATEARWPQINRSAGFPVPYIALVAASGTPEIWWVNPMESFEAMGKMADFGDASYRASVAKVATEDGDHITGSTRMQARALPEASHGAFPEVGKARVYSVLTIRVRPGQEFKFMELAKHFTAIASGSDAAGWRMYEVIAGGLGGTYLAMSSFPSWAAVDANEAAWTKMMANAGPHLQEITKLSSEAIMTTESRYFAVNPRMSVVPKELAARDPFWAVKTATAKSAP